MMRVTTALVLVMAAHAGQEFEVASVKAGDPLASPGSEFAHHAGHGGIEFRNATLKTLVRGALRVKRIPARRRAEVDGLGEI